MGSGAAANTKTNYGNPCDAELGGNNKGEPPDTEEKALMPESSKRRDPPAGGWRAVLEMKTHIWLTVLVTSVIWFIIAIIITIISIVVDRSLRNNPSSAPCPSCPSSCSSGWVGYEGKCYLFSEADTDWESSQSNCSSLGAALTTIHTQKEWVWKIAFQVGANGECAYLNDERASSTWCNTQRNWICSKTLSTC